MSLEEIAERVWFGGVVRTCRSFLQPFFTFCGTRFWSLSRSRCGMYCTIVVNYSRKESKTGEERRAHLARYFNKEQTPLAILRYQPTVSRWFFRCFGAHLLRSP